MSKFHVIIPARYHASRLPGKLLKDIAGKPMIEHVYANAIASGAERVIVATDHRLIAQWAQEQGIEVLMTATTHCSGTERIAEAIQLAAIAADDIVVNVQADEPLLPARCIQQVAVNLAANSECAVATLCEPLTDKEDLFDPNQVKVVMDRFGKALYFSRAPIAWDRDGITKPEQCLHNRHLGIYAMRAQFIEEYVQWEPCSLEQLEVLEQLRILWQGYSIHVAVAEQGVGRGGVDTEQDLARVRSYFAAKSKVETE